MTQTIAAIATAHGVGSISIIRLSGDKAYDIALRLSKRSSFTVRYATLTTLYNSHNELLDEVIAIYFKAPFSFTAEDVIELQCHGGYIVANEILKNCLHLGAHLAKPGEFSKRAFLNGRIDLSEAEAISQLIEAKSEDAAKILARQMKGELRHYIEEVRDELLLILAYCEVSIDYAEEDLPQDLIEQIMQKLDALHVRLNATLQASQSRQGLMQGFKVSIIGKPNVGKSSLLNALLNFNRAIVSEIAGTTRDTIEEQVKIGTHLIRIIDTAGIREAGDEIERIGIERSLKAIHESDVVIALFDSSGILDDEDYAILDLIQEHKKDRTFITVLNKSDLTCKIDTSIFENHQALYLNTKSSTTELINALERIMDANNNSQEMMLISTRQIEAVELTCNEIIASKMPLEDQELEIFSFHLNAALHAIASITRPFENDEMLDKMFGSFCLGK
ncbi:MAG: tRNA uridine-5-carboxymethylaminomethyl(34) synthesis GTPase MnmE [Campylobacterota bacterium]|nr:tRNA uridine-5-carboxymethylaminomethyl(34) synthesis GTPase MnmE [Campylobacterota bacterium]